jgi:hypothetical protein
MNGHPLCSHYAIIIILLHVIASLWFHLSVPMMGRKSQEHSMAGSEHISQEPHYIHDDVSIIPNTEELFEEQNEKENVEARSEIILLSPTEGGLQVLKHHDITLWFH